MTAEEWIAAYAEAMSDMFCAYLEKLAAASLLSHDVEEGERSPKLA